MSEQTSLNQVNINEVKRVSINNWTLLAEPNTFIGTDTNTGIVAKLHKHAKAWKIELSFEGTLLGTIGEKVPDKAIIFQPQPAIVASNPVSIAKAIDAARVLAQQAIQVSGIAYRFTTNNNLYRLFTGTTSKDTPLLSQDQYMVIYARLHKNPTATLQVSFDLKQRNQDTNLDNIVLPPMDIVNKLLEEGYTY
jgi:hypothetical protein